jgi:hypothetical protein
MGSLGPPDWVVPRKVHLPFSQHPLEGAAAAHYTSVFLFHTAFQLKAVCIQRYNLLAESVPSNK